MLNHLISLASALSAGWTPPCNSSLLILMTLAIRVCIALCALAVAVLGARRAVANGGPEQRRSQDSTVDRRPAAQGFMKRNEAFRTLFHSMEPQKQDFFFRPNDANRFRRGATLPVVTDMLVKASFQTPQRLSRETYLFAGHIFMNRFYMRSRGRGGRGYEGLSALRNGELIGRQPWIEWDGGRGQYRFHSGGAAAKLRELVKTTTLYRGMSYGEAGIWKNVKRQLEEKKKKPGGGQHLTARIRTALDNLSPTHRSTFCTPTLSAAEGWSKTSLWKSNQSGRVLQFGIDLKAVPKTLSSQIYLGIEDGYLEVGFFGTNAKAYLAERICGTSTIP